MSLVLIPVKFKATRANGDPVVGATVHAVLTVAESDDGVVVPDNITGTTDSAGELTLNLWPNARGVNGSQYIVTIEGDDLYFSGLITIPEAPSSAWPVLMETLINQPPYPSQPAAQLAQAKAQEYMLQTRAYRDEIAPASGQAIAAAAAAQASAAAAIQAPGVVGFDTVANLNATLTYADKTVAYVTGDTPANNGIYRKNGASGAGSWVFQSTFAANYAGLATPATNAGAQAATSRVFYLASTPGIYANFSGIALAAGEFCSIRWSGTAWVKEVLGNSFSQAVGINKFNSALALAASGYINTSGVPTTLSAGFGNSGFQPVSPNTAYLLSGVGTGSGWGIAAYDSSLAFIAMLPTAGAYNSAMPLQFTTPANTAFLRWTLQFNSSTDYTSTCMLEQTASSTPSAYAAYTRTIDDSHISPAIGRVAPLQANIDAIPTTTIPTRLGQNGPNQQIYPMLLPVTHASLYGVSFTANYIDPSDGVPKVATGWFHSSSIPVAPSTTYTLWEASGTPWAFANVYKLVFCYSNNDFTGYLGSLNQGADGVFTTPAGTKYIAIADSRPQATLNALIPNMRLLVGKAMPYTTKLQYAFDPSTSSAIVTQEKDVIGGNLVRGRVTVKNSERIMFLGNSYTEGNFTIKGKHYIPVLSMFSHFQLMNYGTGGIDLSNMISQLDADTAKFGIKPSQTEVTYAVIICVQNNAGSAATYYANLKTLARKLELLGAQVILSTEHRTDNEAYVKALKQFAYGENLMFCDWRLFAAATRAVDFTPFQYQLHPGTRSNWAFVGGLKPYLDTLPTPAKSIKLFTNRNSYATVADLSYGDVVARAKTFLEVGIGHGCYSTANESSFDKADTVAPGGTSVTDDYGTLILGTSTVAFGTALMAEILTPCRAIDSLAITVKAAGVSNAYLLDKNLVWQPATITNGVVTLAASDSSNYVRSGRVSLLLTGTGIALTDIYADYLGKAVKKDKTKVFKDRTVTGTAILPTTTVNDADTAWTGIVSIPKYTPVLDSLSNPEPLPLGITTVREIDNSSVLTQAITVPADNYKATTVKVKVLCRYFPTYISNPANYAAQSLIKPGTYDAADLNVTLNTGSASVTYTAPVGLWWDTVVMEIETSGTAGTITVASNDAKKIQIAKVEVVW